LSEIAKEILEEGYVEIVPDIISAEEFSQIVRHTLRDTFSRALPDDDRIKSFLNQLFQVVSEDVEEDEAVIIGMDVFEAIAQEHGVPMN
jgi:hypothetical protein